MTHIRKLGMVYLGAVVTILEIPKVLKYTYYFSTLCLYCCGISCSECIFRKSCIEKNKLQQNAYVVTCWIIHLEFILWTGSVLRRQHTLFSYGEYQFLRCLMHSECSRFWIAVFITLGEGSLLVFQSIFEGLVVSDKALSGLLESELAIDSCVLSC
jgi:hypothetical protein